MISRVIDTLVMLVGAVIIGWHLVPPDAVRARTASAAPSSTSDDAPEHHRAVVTPELSSTSPMRAECPEAGHALPPPTAAPLPAPDPDELPQAYRDIIGPLAIASP